MVGRVLTWEKCRCGKKFERAISDRTIDGWHDSELICRSCGRRPGSYFIRLTNLKIITSDDDVAG